MNIYILLSVAHLLNAVGDLSYYKAKNKNNPVSINDVIPALSNIIGMTFAHGLYVDYTTSYHINKLTKKKKGTTTQQKLHKFACI